MIPAVVLRFLPHILITLGIIGAMLWIDHRGYQRRVADEQRAAAMQRIHTEEQMAKIDGHLGAKIDKVRVLRTTIIQPVQKEIIREARYTDPGCFLTAVGLQSDNDARAGSIASGVTIALPEPATPR